MAEENEVLVEEEAPLASSEAAADVAPEAAPVDSETAEEAIAADEVTPDTAPDEATDVASDDDAEVQPEAQPDTQAEAQPEGAPIDEVDEDVEAADAPPKVKRPTAPLLQWLPLVVFGLAIAGGSIALVVSMLMHAGKLLFTVGTATLLADGVIRTLVWAKWRAKLQKILLLQGVQSLIIGALLLVGGYAHNTMLTVVVCAVGANLLYRGAVSIRAGLVRRHLSDGASTESDDADRSDDARDLSGS